MKKAYLLALAMSLPVSAMAVEKDSVYTWGQWSNGIQPAAGPVASITPPPAKLTDVNFRPNENSAFLREAVDVPARVPAPPFIKDQTSVIKITPDTPVSPTGPATGGF